MLISAVQHGWHMVQIDYLLALPQAPIKHTLYMEIPQGFDLEGYNWKYYVLQLHRNI
jgi:hypothetical protein